MTVYISTESPKSEEQTYRSWLTILCLSGGVRGVVELRILGELMREIGYQIPIQELFDLVVGTSTGEHSDVSMRGVLSNDDH